MFDFCAFTLPAECLVSAIISSLDFGPVGPFRTGLRWLCSSGSAGAAKWPSVTLEIRECARKFTLTSVKPPGLCTQMR